MTVLTVFDVEHNRTDGEVGIEIEVDGFDLPNIDNKYWRTEHDGSLNGGGREYVMKKPVQSDLIGPTLEGLKSLIFESGQPVNSVRAGVHVHINVQDLTVVQLYNLFTLYILLEEVLVKWCGKSREGNLFCLRTCDAEWLIFRLINAAQTKEFIPYFHDDDLRYASMNVKALTEYGSLEFRAMRSTMDMKAISNWAKMLLNLKRKSQEFDNPKDIIQGFSAGEVRGVLQQFLGDRAESFSYDGMQEALKSGMRRAQDIAFCVDWGEYV